MVKKIVSLTIVLLTTLVCATDVRDACLSVLRIPSMKTYCQVKYGMSRKETIATIGGPPGVYATDKNDSGA